MGVDLISIACSKADLSLFLDEYNKNKSIINKMFVDIQGDKYPLIFFAVYGGNSKIVEILIENGVDVNTLAKNKQSLLSIATKKGYYEVAKILIEHGANVNHRCNFRSTSLMWAASEGHDEIISLLISNGANLKINPIARIRIGMSSDKKRVLKKARELQKKGMLSTMN
jgi:ankyrin repeat protein